MSECGVLSTIDLVSFKLQKMCGQIAMCKCCASLVTKQSIFPSKWNSIEKKTFKIFDCTQWFSLQSLNSTIRLYKFVFGDN